MLLGLYIAWNVAPVSYSNSEPVDLGTSEKEDYIRMIAATYNIEGDLQLANRRLYYLQVPQLDATLSNLILKEQNPRAQQALVHLLLDLRDPAVALARPTNTPRPLGIRNSSPTAPALPTVLMPVPTETPTVVINQIENPVAPTLPLPTSAANPNAPHFDLIAKRALSCSELAGTAQIRVLVEDTTGKGLPGVEVEVSSDVGNQAFFTGLKPEHGSGYADISLPAGSYNVHLIENAQSGVVSDLQIDPGALECSLGSGQAPGWELVFKQSQ